MDTPMAISNYLAAIIVMILGYPFALVAIQIAIYDKSFRSKFSRWFNLGMLVVLAVLFYLHLQTEVIYGKELLDAWNAANSK
ncbi:hypothetical protein [Vibrio sp. SCSIO 43136]|uniref:hypothetical protein n=1 Tax=Vibrio sp. SCSIO 43136 TaxID=2819101 RepID=UPI002075E302|nr:hypothetical protein [Vibrio sp. SCSIO 43136]USD67768.1 hypothetical protein J4N39_16400 [Vibrio sp. SCSIO 43136]